MNRLAVVGSRGFTDYKVLSIVIGEIRCVYDVDAIVSGGAKGADALARRYAWDNDIIVDEYLPDWEGLGKGAGFIRNKEIWDNSDFGVAFWDGSSKGTLHSFSLAKKQNKTIYVFEYITSKFYEYNTS